MQKSLEVCFQSFAVILKMMVFLYVIDLTIVIYWQREETEVLGIPDYT